tara:strand:+ start:2522 stop:3451 length:930 start_codon:yes stop_codon:yes gene_type:complete
MFKNIFYALFISVFCITEVLSSSNIFILAIINDQIITNHDVKKESEYLKTLNPKLSSLNNNQIFQISKDSLIKEIIKKSELKKIYDLSQEHPLVEEYLENLYKRLNFNDLDQFKNSISNSENYLIKEIREKLKIEILWNDLIVRRYSSLIKIDKRLLLKKIEKLENKEIKEYFLSEISFKKEKEQNVSETILMINKSISEIGFNNTANIYSNSESAKLGGEIGWINQNNLSSKIFNEIKNLEEGQISNSIQLGNSFLILKVEKIRSKKNLLDKNEELNKLINFEKNKQFNQFSKIYFDKTKINYSINEK